MRILVTLSLGLVVVLLCSGFEIRVQDDEKSINAVYIADDIKTKCEDSDRDGFNKVYFRIYKTVLKPAGIGYREQLKDSTFFFYLGVRSGEKINIRKGDTLELTVDSEKIIHLCTQFMAQPKVNSWREFGRRTLSVYLEFPMYDVKRETIVKLSAAKKASFVVKGREFSMKVKIPKEGIKEIRQFCDLYLQ